MKPWTTELSSLVLVGPLTEDNKDSPGARGGGGGDPIP